jgi:hypothetical protein
MQSTTTKGSGMALDYTQVRQMSELDLQIALDGNQDPHERGLLFREIQSRRFGNPQDLCELTAVDSEWGSAYHGPAFRT